MNGDLVDILEEALQYSSTLSETLPIDGMATVDELGSVNELHVDAYYASKTKGSCEIANNSDGDINIYSRLLSDYSENSRLCRSLEPTSQAEAIDVLNQNNFDFSVINGSDNCQFNINKEKDDFVIGNFEQMEESCIIVHGDMDEIAEDEGLSQCLPLTTLAELHPNDTSGQINGGHGKMRVESIGKHQKVKRLTDKSPSQSRIKVKRRRRREKNPDPPPPTILPPCSICDEKSSGYHYGANTCEACKGFYRRTLKKTEIDYKCKCTPDERESWKRGPLKNGCPACRYEKCLAVGMSKNAIKIGRYTLNHKTKNIKEIKTIETINSFISTVLDEQSSFSNHETFATASSDVINELFGDQTCGDNQQLDGQVLPLSHQSDNSTINLKDIESMVKTLTEAHTSLFIDERVGMPTETIRDAQDDYLEKYKSKVEVLGNLSKDEFVSFYKATGLDIDGRIERLHEAFRFFEKNIPMTVEFAKAIPGFQLLGLEDQAKLIKVSRIENAMFCVYKMALRSTDTERHVVTSPWGKHFHFDEVKKLIPMEILQKRHEAMRKMLELDLSIQEESILRAILIVYSDRCSLDEPQKVDEIQEKLMKCLQYLIKIRPGGSGTLMYRIINIITNLRDITDRGMRFAKSFFANCPMLSIENYPLLRELVM